MNWKFSIPYGTTISAIMASGKSTFFKISSCCVLVLFLIIAHAASSQVPPEMLPEVVAVTARPAVDSIALRWAPINFNVWLQGTRYGYKVERYTLARNGKMLAIPVRSILNPAIKPLPEDAWEDLANDNKYAAIAAQALFGERFEIDLRNSDVFTIANKVRENEQRFAFALFCADMSPAVAAASGLMFTDTDVAPGEKYLYRISVNNGDTLRGSIFVASGERYALFKPENLELTFKGTLVELKWKRSNQSHYTAYRVERSNDGVHFEPVSDSPLVTVSPVETDDPMFHYAIDSVTDQTATVHYRVRGITPFGETGPPSDVVSGRSVPEVHQVPYIVDVENINNQSLFIRWDFPANNEDAVAGFIVQRATHAAGDFTTLVSQPLVPAARSYQDKTPKQVNYYRVAAMGKDGEQYFSPLFFGQLIDSVPPTPPQGLQARIHADGIVNITWIPNQEDDLYGYRVYMSHHRSEEPVQLTTAPIASAFLIDTVEVRTLNEYVYYRVMAIDRNQNHSALSALLEVALPDQVPPQPPVLLPVTSDARGVSLSWLPGPSTDVTHYHIYRKAVDEETWKRIAVVANDTDSVFYHLDADLTPGNVHHYTILSVDDAGLESHPAVAVTGSKIDTRPEPPVRWRNPVMLREENKITLRWTYDGKDIEGYRIYKAVSGNPLVLFSIAAAEFREWQDKLVPTEDYAYRIMAVFTNGRKSTLSEELIVDY